MSSRLTWAAQPDPCCSCAGKDHGLESMADKEETEERLERPEKPLSFYVQMHASREVWEGGALTACVVLSRPTQGSTLQVLMATAEGREKAQRG